MSHQFQTVEVAGASGRLPGGKRNYVQRPNLPRHGNQRAMRKDMPREGAAHEGGPDAFRHGSQQLDDSVELSKQTLTFRKNRQLHRHDQYDQQPSYLDTTEDASLIEDDLRQEDEQPYFPDNQKQRRGSHKHHSQFQTLPNEGSRGGAMKSDHGQKHNNATLQRNLNSIDAHEHQRGNNQFFDEDRQTIDNQDMVEERPS